MCYYLGALNKSQAKCLLHKSNRGIARVNTPKEEQSSLPSTSPKRHTSLSDSLFMKHQDDSERSLWSAFKKGNHLAFSQIYANYSQALYNYCRQFSRNEELVKDCIQDLFVDLWTNRANIKTPSRPKNYLYKSIRNNLLRKLASRKNDSLALGLPDHYPFFATLDTEAEWINKEKKNEISHALKEVFEHLTVRQKEVIFLRFYENYDYKEIAEIMDISTKATYKLLYRAIEALRANLPPHLYNLMLLIFWHGRLKYSGIHGVKKASFVL